MRDLGTLRALDEGSSSDGVPEGPAPLARKDSAIPAPDIAHWATDDELRWCEEWSSELKAVRQWAPDLERPFLMLLLEDVCVHSIMARRVDARLKEGGAVGRLAWEDIVAVRKHLRDSILDTMQLMMKIGMPKQPGLADVMKPIVHQASGVMELLLAENKAWKVEHGDVEYDDDNPAHRAWMEEYEAGENE